MSSLRVMVGILFFSSHSDTWRSCSRVSQMMDSFFSSSVSSRPVQCFTMSYHHPLVRYTHFAMHGKFGFQSAHSTIDLKTFFPPHFLFCGILAFFAKQSDLNIFSWARWGVPSTPPRFAHAHPSACFKTCSGF